MKNGSSFYILNGLMHINCIFTSFANRHRDISPLETASLIINDKLRNLKMPASQRAEASQEIQCRGDSSIYP